uniref:Uncharacterized protein n=1 Tax=Tanacetum cinerariifolium TaxID=118510 RepID=A0A699HBM0_TANCI|nr:hypothetical protein [Tanacetum cinerariifolium]
MSHLEEFACAANSTLFGDQFLIHFDRENEMEIKMSKELLKQCVAFLREIQDWELEKIAEIIRMVTKSNGHVIEKINFVLAIRWVISGLRLILWGSFVNGSGGGCCFLRRVGRNCQRLLLKDVVKNEVNLASSASETEMKLEDMLLSFKDLTSVGI